MAKKYNQQDFVDKVKSVHGNKIDVSEFVYTNSLGSGKCTCNVCGNVWYPRADALMRGVGCRKCYNRRNSERRIIGLDEIQRRIYGSGVNVTIIGEYVDTKHKCLARCNECGHEWHTKAQELTRGHGCPKCGKAKDTVSGFIKKCEEKWGDKYLYDKVRETFTGHTNMVTIGCKKHGYFQIKGQTFLNGNTEKCPECAREQKEERQRQAAEIRKQKKHEYWLKCKERREAVLAKNGGRKPLYEMSGKEREAEVQRRKEERHEKYSANFLERLKEIYRDEPYDFSKTKFVSWKEKVTVTCLKHGDFEKAPSSLMHGLKCPLCARTGKKYTTEEWIKLAKEVHPEFTYDRTVYVNKGTSLIVTCPIHGNITVKPNAFLRKKGNPCPKCQDDARREERRREQLERIKEIYKDKPYTIVDDYFYNTTDKIVVRCDKHDVVFTPSVGNILSTGCGCPQCGVEKCGGIRRLGSEEIVRKIKEVHGNEYDTTHILEMDDLTTETPITLVCKEHGEFVKTPHALFAGQGCPVCGRINAGMKTRLTQDEFMGRIMEKHAGKELDFSKTVYTRGCDYVEVICNHVDKSSGLEHGSFMIKAGNLLIGNGCPKCASSHLESEVRAKFVLDGFKDFVEQKRFPEWLGWQSYDFFIVGKNIAIECQGGQHFITDFFNYKSIDNPEEHFKLIQERDENKRRLSKEHGIELVYYVHKNFAKYVEKLPNRFFTDLDDLLNFVKSAPNIPVIGKDSVSLQQNREQDIQV